MTINDAYKYAKKLYRKHLTNIQLEEHMRAESHSDENIAKVRYWLSKWTNGITSY